MRDDPWTAANRDKEHQTVAIPPKRKQTAETASPPAKPTVSGPFWTGKNPRPMPLTRDNEQMIERACKRVSKSQERISRLLLATVALYGPDDPTPTKLTVGIVPAEHGDATELRRWFSEGGRYPQRCRFCGGSVRVSHGGRARSVFMTDKIIGYLHEESAETGIGPRLSTTALV